MIELMVVMNVRECSRKSNEVQNKGEHVLGCSRAGKTLIAEPRRHTCLLAKHRFACVRSLVLRARQIKSGAATAMGARWGRVKARVQ